MTPSQAQNLIPGESKVLLNYTGGFKRIRKVHSVSPKVWISSKGIPFCWIGLEVEVMRWDKKSSYIEIHGHPSYAIRSIY